MQSGLPLTKHLSMIYRYSRRFLTKALAPLEVETGQYPFLMILYRLPGLTQEQLSAELGMDKGTTARMVAQLEQSGLLERRVDGADKRANHLYPTERALALAGTLRGISRRMQETLLAGFTPDERAQTETLLLRMRDNIRHGL